MMDLGMIEMGLLCITYTPEPAQSQGGPGQLPANEHEWALIRPCSRDGYGAEDWSTLWTEGSKLRSGQKIYGFINRLLLKVDFQ
jgi:hypothetical protein